MRRWVVVVLVLVGVLFAASVAGATTVYFYDQARSDKLADGVVIAGVDVSGLKTDVAEARVRQALLPPLQTPIELTYGDQRFVIRPDKAGLRVDVSGMVARALEATRDGNVIDRFLREVRNRPLNLNVPLSAAYSQSSVEAFSRWVGRRLGDPAKSASVVPTASSISIVRSHTGLAVDTDQLSRELEQRIVDPNADRTLTVPTRTVTPPITTAQLAHKYPSYLLVDRETFQLRLFRGLQLFKTYRIAVGRAGLETPAGLYRIYDKQVNPSWHVPNSAWAGDLAGRVIPPGPDDPIKARWMGFYNGAGIHGTDDISSLGSAASHGCIRMSIPDVEELYDLVPYGTPIYVD